MMSGHLKCLKRLDLTNDYINKVTLVDPYIDWVHTCFVRLQGDVLFSKHSLNASHLSNAVLFIG